MQSNRLSIIVPTPDGGTLPLLAQSLNHQLRDGDEVIVVGDAFSDKLTPAVKTWVEAVGWRYLEYDAGYMGWGHPQINYGIEHARGDYLAFQDDDDVYAPDFILNYHRATRHLDPPRPLLFRFKARRYGNIPIWQRRGVLEVGTIGGHCIVTPNVPEKTGKWTDRYEGDYDFIAETLRLWEPLQPEWRQEVIAYAR